MTRVRAGAGAAIGGAIYGSGGGGIGAAIGGGGGAGGGLWLHAATTAKTDAIINGLDKLTNGLSLDRAAIHIEQNSKPFVQPKGVIASANDILEPQPDHVAVDPSAWLSEQCPEPLPRRR